ncbi:hypothetical protein ACROSR_19865 [Roseovarius tibetensis]|uniref:hypothetical protein n=1 Tax=Roseovarius tibetensis TaxID=2685897 RepID=UPI003D7F8408
MANDTFAVGAVRSTTPGFSARYWKPEAIIRCHLEVSSHVNLVVARPGAYLLLMRLHSIGDCTLLIKIIALMRIR